ncbi:MAG TPA: Dna2/Cas4 domain-containing protein [Anaerolineae bacterium]|nr:Dna2/Cas4 domain-containing protein [Anaerolineae bacterium]
MTSDLWILGVVVLLLGVGLFLLLFSRRRQAEAGLPHGRIIYTDTATWFPNQSPLSDRNLKLTGKPDYLVEEDGQIIPVEIKSGRAPQTPWEGHVMQLAAYCRLVWVNYDVRPDYGIIQYEDRAFAVAYTALLEEELLDVLTEMRQDMFAADVPRDHDDWARCSRCGVRLDCDQRLAD